MASTKDVHDIMGMGPDARNVSAPKKKKKVIETQPRLSGISREVQALMGDSVPPVQIVETPKYKSKPTLASKLFKVRHWEERPFQHAARSDGLVLKHWKRAQTIARPLQSNGDVEMVNNDLEQPETQFEEEFAMDRWNVKIRIPEYTEEQYEKHFTSDEWTQEETDYLMTLASDFDLRWILITDRYTPEDIRPRINTGEETNGIELTRTYPDRNMEALKSRYYQVAAKDLELRTPASNMTQNEFQLWEKMRNFDAKTEVLRKTMAEKLFERTKDEAEEEKTLLEELNRITKNEEDFKAMRRDLYARLEAAPSLRRNERGEEQNIILSSAGLSDLFSRLLAKEKHMKRRIAPNGEAAPPTGQPAADQSRRQSTQVHRRDTIETPATDSKKGSISAPVIRQLSKADEEKYGVTHSSERLTSGVSFRHEKINRVTTAKSQVQTQKINAALTELEIPARLSMPTEKVCKEFERLVSQIQLLLDARKTHTRVSEEVKVLEEARRQRLGEPNPPTSDAVNETHMDVDDREVGTSQSQPTRDAGSANNQDRKGSRSQLSQSGNDLEDGPGPAVHDDDDDDDDDDAEAEDDTEVADMTQTQLNGDEDEDEEEEDDDDEDRDERAGSRRRKADANDEDDEEEDEDGDDDETNNLEADEDDEDGGGDEDDDDDDDGIRALRRAAEEDEEEDEAEENMDEDDEDDEQSEEGDEQPESNRRHVNGATSDAEEDEDGEEEDEEGDEEDVQNASMDENTHNADSDDDDQASEGNDDQSSRPVSSGSLAAPSHKRSASVMSEASKAGSNRSGIGRKRKR